MDDKNLMAKARVQVELEELNTKMGKLQKFVASPNSKNLSRVSYELLCLQLTTMETYSDILIKRLSYWDDPKSAAE